MTAVSRSPVELARGIAEDWTEAMKMMPDDMQEVARALLDAESAFEEIGRHPGNAGKVAEFALSVLRGSE